MFKQILVISDNLGLCKSFNEIIQDKQYSASTWTFSVSPYSNAELFETVLHRKVFSYDLKQAAVTGLLVQTFDLVISVHCKQLFPPALVKAVKCINVHPGYNPINRGWYPQVFSIVNNLPIGATIHEIDEQLDHGKIIDRAFVNKEIFDTSESLYKKIIAKEIELVRKNLYAIIHNQVPVFEPEGEGNLYLKSDFNKLLLFDLNKTMTGMEFINQLRALTHGDHKNAYFHDPNTGKKIFIKISLEPDESA